MRRRLKRQQAWCLEWFWKSFYPEKYGKWVKGFMPTSDTVWFMLQTKSKGRKPGGKRQDQRLSHERRWTMKVVMEVSRRRWMDLRGVWDPVILIICRLWPWPLGRWGCDMMRLRDRGWGANLQEEDTEYILKYLWTIWGEFRSRAVALWCMNLRVYPCTEGPDFGVQILLLSSYHAPPQDRKHRTFDLFE